MSEKNRKEMSSMLADVDQVMIEIKQEEEKGKIAWENNELPENASLSYFLKYKLRNGELLIDFHGHHKVGSKVPISAENSGIDDFNYQHGYFYDKLCGGITFTMLRLDDDDGIDQKIRNGEKLDKPLYLNYDYCGECGNKIAYWFDGEKFEVRNYIGNVLPEVSLKENPDCPEFGGLKDHVVEIDVPSGEIVFANDFRSLTPEAEHDRYINQNIEKNKMISDYAEHNVLMAFVGNSCPGVFTKDGLITVGNTGFDEDDQPAQDFGEEHGSICTDLWWFSAMDKAQFKKLLMDKLTELDKIGDQKTILKTYDARLKDWPELSIKVEPGRYRMTVFVDPAVDDSGSWYRGECFAQIERVKE